jgi:uncharacterized protein
MSLTMHQAVLPPVLRTLKAFDAILDKAAAHCAARKIDPAALLAYRLAPDMFDLKRQIQIMSDQAKGVAARLADVEVPKYEDTETTIDELKARIGKTLDFVSSIAAERFDGAEDREIVMKMRGGEKRFTGRDYAFSFVLPNFYFHATTAYDILRHAGMELSKMDFLGAN